MEQLALFILATAGLTWILVKSKLFKPLRERLTTSYHFYIGKAGVLNSVKLYIFYFFDSIFNREGCMGFWSGLVNYWIITKNIDLGMIVYGFAGSIVSLVSIALFNYFNRK